MSIDENFKKIAEEVAQNGDFLILPMERLRVGYEAERLGTHVLSGIRQKLQKYALGWLPVELPKDCNAEIRLYARGRKLGDIVEAVLTPSSKGDSLLIEVTRGEALKTIQRIRELVGD